MNLKPSASANIDVLCIGNAIVDLLTQTDEETLDRLGVQKGSMSIVDYEKINLLYNQLGPGIETSGGSAANTAAGLASLGSKCAYIGKVRNDNIGKIFTDDIRAIGATYDTMPSIEGSSTARCLICVTPDAERTMHTYLGACSELGPNDIDGGLISRSQITYLEGYLWDREQAKQAFLKATKLSHEAGRMTALTLSDSFCVDRHRDSFKNLIRNYIDILFANEDEIISLYEVDDFDSAVRLAREDCKISVLTRSEKGSVVISGDELMVVPAENVSTLVDTTGAGDQYAAGFLHGYTSGCNLTVCAEIGGIAAAEVISHFGPRPESSLAELVMQRTSSN
jgi:sugar/nucleoside kinase (ribokinase family)|tara:strand:- start:1855 stop:2868 length:1014 start_codon:yes stop_codon:yes gene_type:complete